MTRTAAIIAATLFAFAASMVQAAGVETSLRPQPRKVEDTVAIASSNTRFDAWLRSFRARAVANGISGSVYDRAVRGIKYDPEVVRRDRNQSEFTKHIWQYLDTAVSDSRVLCSCSLR